MSHPWTNQASNFCPHGNQVPCNRNSNQNLNKTKAYLNPQIVNYEFIRRTLSKNCLPGGNKIHVNPNFMGNSLTNFSNQHYSNANTINLQDLQSPKPGTSKTTNIIEKNIKQSSKDSKESLNSSGSIAVQSFFKKVNTVNVKTKKSLYSWSKSSSLLNSNQSIPLISNITPVLEKQNNFEYSNFEYKAPKKTCQMRSETYLPEKRQKIFKSKTKIINKSKTKLLNNVSPKSRGKMNSLIKRQLSLLRSTFNKNKRTSVSMVAKAVRNKYIYLNHLEQYKKSKYKIDKRNKSPDTVKKKLNPKKAKDIRKLFPTYIYNRLKLSPCNVYSVASYKTVSKSLYLWRKNQTYDKVTQKLVSNKFPNRRVIKIGGILYKSTANKLTLATKKVESASKKKVNNVATGSKNYTVYVRGEKFILENNGKALRRQSETTTNEKTLLLTPKRIDIGGVTYLRKSQNVLIRTNLHEARYLVNKAKNKSIALLINLHKRSSMPCMIYHRFGRCIRHNKGLCMYRHDKKNIAVCKKFLNGNCANNNCLLSHQVVQEKMATCHFFLNGHCVRENCPFLHVKLNKKAALCENFLQGFCKLGKECLKRHFYQCPKFDKTGSCDLGPKCPYPHKNGESRGEESNKVKEGNERVHYYVTSDTQRKQKKIKKSIMKVKEGVDAKVQKKVTKRKVLSQNDSDQNVSNNSAVKCYPKRVKLDKLPCFIPLISE